MMGLRVGNLTGTLTVHAEKYVCVKILFYFSFSFQVSALVKVDFPQKGMYLHLHRDQTIYIAIPVNYP